MRIRSVVAIVLLLLPAVSDAQRVRLPRMGRGPARPTPLPPQPAVVSRALAYKRLPLSVESYPLISHFQAAGFVAPGVVTSWTSGGVGTRLDYRVARHVSATVDMTSSFFGGPARTQTLELGTRLRPERSERRLYPFIDVRAGYVSAYDSFMRPGDFADPFAPTLGGMGSRYSQGVGGVGGVGLEYALTRMISLTTAASAMRARMTTYNFRGVAPANASYLMTSYRYTLGIRFNPARLMRTTGTDLPVSAAPRI